MKKILITGAAGMLGYALQKELSDYPLLNVDLPQYDLTDRAVVKKIFTDQPLQFVYHLAAFTNVDLCETEQQQAEAVNHLAVRYLAEESAERGIPMLAISTDYVFDGEADQPYREDHPGDPQSVYGRTKLAGEEALRSINPAHFIVRTAWLYGPNGKNFAKTIFEAAKQADPLRVVADQIGSPTYTFDLAAALKQFLDSDAYGTYHIVNKQQTSWYGFAREIVPDKEVIAVNSDEYPRPARRPHYSVLDTAKFEKQFDYQLPTWHDAIRRYKNEYLL